MLSDTQHYGWYDTASDSSSHWIMKITIRNFFLQYPQTHIHIKHIHMYSCTHTGTYTYANDQTWHSSVTFNCLKTACPMMLLAQYSSGAYLSTELSTHVELLLFSSSNVTLSFRKTSQLPIAFSVTLFVFFPFCNSSSFLQILTRILLLWQAFTYPHTRHVLLPRDGLLHCPCPSVNGYAHVPWALWCLYVWFILNTIYHQGPAKWWVQNK